MPNSAEHIVDEPGGRATRQHMPDDALAGGRVSTAVSAFTRRYRWPVAFVWVVLLGIGSVGALSLNSVLSGGGWYASGSQSQQSVEALSEAGMLGRGETSLSLVIHDREHTVSEAAFDTRARSVVDAVWGDQVLGVSSAYGWSTLDGEAKAQYVGEDQRTVTDALALEITDGDARRELPAVQQRLTDEFGSQGLDVSLVGAPSFWGAVNTLSQSGLITAELIALPLITLILIFLSRSLVAVAASMAVGISTIVLTLGALSPLAHHIELSIFMENAATMLGLGVGIDYSLFVIARFQEELARGRSVSAAVTQSLQRAGHTVVFSGLTVVATMSTLFIIDLNVIFSLALGAVSVVACSILVTTLLLPALLHILGHNINRGRPPFLRPRPVIGTAQGQSSNGRWHRFSLAVMRRPVVYGLAGVIALAVLAIPATQLKTFSPDARILPASSPVREGFDRIQQQFGIGATSPVQVVVQTPSSVLGSADSEAIAQLRDQLAGLPHVTSIRSVLDVAATIAPDNPVQVLQNPDLLSGLPPDVQPDVRQAFAHYLSDDGRTTVIELITDTRASDDAARELVEQARGVVAELDEAGISAIVGGETAEGIDANDVIADNLLPVIALMLAVVFVLLLITFRSVVLPIKAVALNLLSLAATYGILVSVFQNGFLAGLLGLDQTGYLQNFVPILLLALLFSLSTDYEVFLLNRVRENYQRTGNNTKAVAEAVESTAPLISGAAILMVAVFGAFAFTGMVPIEQLGFGMALAILIDATIVRLVLVPAAMKLMGSWNWWFPGDRRASSPSTDRQGSQPETAHPSAAASR